MVKSTQPVYLWRNGRQRQSHIILWFKPCPVLIFPLVFLPILQVWPLAKKCVIYNCNGRCILTVRNRISTNKSRKLHFITFMTLFVFDAENKYLNPQAN